LLPAIQNAKLVATVFWPGFVAVLLMSPLPEPVVKSDIPLVLVLCTGNSCRSHIAEGILRNSAQDKFRVASAGSKPADYVHPLAIQVMNEIGIDISAHHSKHMNDFLQQKVETVITVCGNAD
jgi:arsenate reductase